VDDPSWDLRMGSLGRGRRPKFLVLRRLGKRAVNDPGSSSAQTRAPLKRLRDLPTLPEYIDSPISIPNFLNKPLCVPT